MENAEQTDNQDIAENIREQDEQEEIDATRQKWERDYPNLLKLLDKRRS